MKKIIFIFAMIVCGIMTSNAQNYKIEGNTITSTKIARVKSEPIKTSFNYKDSKGNEYPIFMSSTGSCFVLKTSSKTGKEYRNYLGPEMSSDICQRLGVEYKAKRKQ